MEIIPAINCDKKACVEERAALIKMIGAETAHVDITDGYFSTHPTLNDPKAYSSTGLSLEVHFMVKEPELIIDEWLVAGVKRIILHVESFTGKPESAFSDIADKCRAYGVELALAANPDTPVDDLFIYAGSVMTFELLAVTPGPSGQSFDDGIIEKIKMLRARFPEAEIEIDGGVNPQIAQTAAKAGATRAVSASYIFSHADPAIAFQELKQHGVI